jgi:hypothetical protein
MWKEGLSFALLAWSLNALALVFGAYLGPRGLLDPRWAAKLVRLQADEQGGGFAEFRATFGGLFLASHAAALFFSVKWIANGEPVVGVFAAGAAAVLAAAWIGTGFGRFYSMLRDNTRTPFNIMSAWIELLVGAMIGAPWALWGFTLPG